MSGVRALAAFAVTGLSLAGCATFERNEVTGQEQWLAAAGFRAQPADTPEKMSSLASRPAHKLVSQPEDDHYVYSYAHPDYCRCLYFGGPEEYSAYERLRLARQVALEEYRIGWGVWGPRWW